MNWPTPAPGKINCKGCGNPNVEGCAECKRCKEYCGCNCVNCGNCTPLKAWTDAKFVRHSRSILCKTCRKCPRTTQYPNDTYKCVCHSRPKHMKGWVMRKGAHTLNPLRRPLGLEIEVSRMGHTANGGIPMMTKQPKHLSWDWVHDGSLTAGGQEMVLYPMEGDNFVDGVTRLAKYFADWKFEVDKTCGLHAHVGADAPFGAFELRRLILMYRKFEDVFYKLVTPGRDMSRVVRGETKWYAKRWEFPQQFYNLLQEASTAQAIRQCIVRTLYPAHVSEGLPGQVRVDMRRARAHKYEKCRYYGLNLHTWFERGTVEFRHHQGTLLESDLKYWPLFCGWFVELASVLPDSYVFGLNTVQDLLNSSWSLHGQIVQIPADVREWVVETLRSRKADHEKFEKKPKKKQVVEQLPRDPLRVVEVGGRQFRWDAEQEMYVAIEQPVPAPVRDEDDEEVF